MPQQKGFTFLEVLISLLLLSFILLSFTASQITALHAMQKASLYQTATQQLNNLIARLQSTSPENQSAHLQQWNHENQSVLPQGHGTLQQQNHQHRIEIFWGKTTPPCQHNHIGLTGCLTTTLSHKN